MPFDSSVYVLLKEEFVRKKLGPVQQLNNRFIDIRFIFHSGDDIINEVDDDDLDPIFVGSKRKHPSRQDSARKFQTPFGGAIRFFQQPSSVAAGLQSSSIRLQSSVLKV